MHSQSHESAKINHKMMDLLADILDVCRPVQAVAKDHI